MTATPATCAAVRCDTVITLSWYCVWCGDHYQGVKHCYRCQTGIYSIEEANWQINYICSSG
ncbi:putative zinc ribbon protein [Enterobacter cloacae]|uniref:putative zinc ribbon protein n=1 Tax=Enterobacter cloacae TaxID=550 RepID=UPI003DA78AEC